MFSFDAQQPHGRRYSGIVQTDHALSPLGLAFAKQTPGLPVVVADFEIEIGRSILLNQLRRSAWRFRQGFGKTFSRWPLPGPVPTGLDQFFVFNALR